MIDRKRQILRVASELLQSRSFTSFSYQDLSDRLGISKASIHHHFATKEDLLLALTERYCAGQQAKLREIDEEHQRPWDRLEAYLDLMAGIMQSGNKICAAGALQSELTVLPERVCERVRDLFEHPKAWLAGVLAEGRERGEMAFEGAPEERAVLILAAVQGGLQIARAEGPREFTAIIRQIKTALKPKKDQNQGSDNAVKTVPVTETVAMEEESTGSSQPSR